MALESGTLLWYLDEAQVYPEDAAALLDSCQHTERELENGEKIIVVSAQNIEGKSVVVELGIKPAELLFWKNAIDLHVDALARSGAVLSSADLTLDDVDAGEDGLAASSIRMSIKGGETYSLVITAQDDVAIVAKQFILDHGLKKEMESTIERELLKAQVNGCLMRESKLKKQISQIRRRLGDVAIAESRAAVAEQHAATLASTLLSIELLTPHIHSHLDDARKTAAERELEIKELMRQLREEEAFIQKLAQESDDLADAMVEQQEQVRQARAERDAAEAERLSHSHGDGSAPPPPPPPPPLPSPASSKEMSLPSELRRSNVALTQQLLLREQEIRRLQQDLKAATVSAQRATALRVKGVSTPGAPQPSAAPAGDEALLDELQQQRRRTAKLEEKIKYLTGSLKASDETRAHLTAKAEEASAAANLAQSQVRRSEATIARLGQEIRELRQTASARNQDSLLTENRSLREEVVRFRGEVLRLQTHIDDVQASAVHAVQSLQLLGPPRVSSPAAPSSPQRLSTASASASAAASVVAATPPSFKHQQRVASEFKGSAAASSPESPTPQVFLDLSSSTRGKDARDLGTELLNNQNTSTSTYVWEPTQDVASARISPVVEERLLHDIYHRYVGETPHVGTTTSMTLSKFGRFTKDFGISIIAKGAAQPPFLVNGEIDVIFLNAAQTTPENRDLPERAPRAFGVRAGAGTQQQYKRSAVGAAGAAPVLSVGQFITAVKVLACQLYANVIEHETGTVLECLPPRQRETASRAVLDVLLKKKLVPVAERLGLIPWPLIYLDQTVTVLATFHEASSALSRNFRLIVAWFEHYSSGSRGSLPYKSLSRFAHDFGMVPYLLKEPQLFR